jgi:cytochrome c5
MTTIKPFMSVFVCGLLFLASCSNEVLPNKEQLPQSSKESAEGKKLAAGKVIYESNCAGCHNSNVAGAPTPGDKADWTARMAQGVDAMTKKSIEGFEGKKGVMQPRGGNASLTDEEVRNAVLYMVKISQ